MANSHDSTGREGQPSGGPNGQSAAKGFLSNAQVLWCPTPRMGGLNPRIVVDSSQQEPSISDRVQDQPITIAGTFFFLPPPLQFPLSESPLLCPLPLIYFESQCSSFQTLRMRLHCFRRFASIERGRAFLASTVPPLLNTGRGSTGTSVRRKKKRKRTRPPPLSFLPPLPPRLNEFSCFKASPVHEAYNQLHPQ